MDLRAAAGMEHLTPAELARAGRIADPARGALELRARAHLRRLLCAYSGLDNAALRFGRGPRGKPKLDNELPAGKLRFNYSVSGARALYAFAWNRELGVDLEAWPRAFNADGLARRVLSGAERAAWLALPEGGRAAAMLACWTRKEAYGKALGVGIRYQLNRAQVFTDLHRPAWECEVAGLFPGTSPATAARALYGVQFAPPFAGVAAVVYDGEADAELRGFTVATGDGGSRIDGGAPGESFTPTRKS